MIIIQYNIKELKKITIMYNDIKTDKPCTLHSVLCSTSDEPENCTKEYNEEVCGECEFRKSEMVGHPGGSSYHSTVRHWCDWGHWKDDF